MISQNRRSRFNDSTIYQDIFDEIVLQAMKRGMVDGKRPLKRDKDDDSAELTRQIKVSRTDSDSGYMVRDGKRAHQNFRI